MSTSNINTAFERGIRVASESVAKARAAHEHASAENQVAQAARTEVLDRIAKLNADRSAIVEARRAGKLAHDQGARLAAAAADLEIATEVLAEREAAASNALKAVNEADTAVRHAEDKLAQITARAEFEGVISRLREIETVFASALTRAQELHKMIAPGGSRFMYAPAPGLCDIVRRLDLGRLDHARGGTAAY